MRTNNWPYSNSLLISSLCLCTVNLDSLACPLFSSYDCKRPSRPCACLSSSFSPTSSQSHHCQTKLSASLASSRRRRWRQQQQQPRRTAWQQLRWWTVGLYKQTETLADPARRLGARMFSRVWSPLAWWWAGARMSIWQDGVIVNEISAASRGMIFIWPFNIGLRYRKRIPTNFESALLGKS